MSIARRRGLVSLLAAVSVTCIHLQGEASISAGASAGMSAAGQDSWTGAFDMSAAAGADLGFTFDVGPFNMRPHLGLWLGYDDNVYAENGDEVDDYTLTIAPGILVVYGNPSRNYLSANYTYEMVRYESESDADYEAHNLATDAHLEASKTTFHLGDRFINTVVDNPEVAERTDKIQNILHGDIERYISSKTSVGINGRYEIHDYEERTYIDYDEYYAGARVYYRIRPKTDVFGEAGYGWVDLQPLPEDVTADLTSRYDDITLTDSYGDAEYQEVSVGVRGQVGRKSEAMGKVGYQYRDFDDPEINDIDTWTMSVGISTRFSSRFNAGVQAYRRIYPWTTVPGNSAVATSVSPYVRRQLWGNRISISGSFTYEWVDYYDRAGDSDRKDEFWQATGIVDYKPSQSWTFGIGYSYSENDSTEDGSDTQRSRIIARAACNY